MSMLLYQPPNTSFSQTTTKDEVVSQLVNFLRSNANGWYNQKSTSESASLFALENYLQGLTTQNTNYLQKDGNVTLFEKYRDAYVLMVRACRLHSKDSTVPILPDPEVQQLRKFLEELEKNKPSKEIPKDQEEVIRNLLAIGEIFGDNQLKSKISEYNNKSSKDKFDILIKCKDLVTDILNKPGKLVGVENFKFSQGTPVNKIEESLLKEHVLSAPFTFPYYRQINRVYVPMWVADPVDIIANGIRSLLYSLIEFGVHNGLNGDALKDLCFGNNLVNEIKIDEKNKTFIVSFNEGNIINMANTIKNKFKLSKNSLNEVENNLSGAFNNYEQNKSTSDVKNKRRNNSYNEFFTNNKQLIMNYALAVSTANLINEFVLANFFKSISSNGTVRESVKDLGFTWGNISQDIIRNNLLSKVCVVDASTTNFGGVINQELERKSYEKFSDNNVESINQIIGNLPDGQYVQFTDSLGRKFLFQKENGKINVYMPFNLLSVGSATHESTLSAVDEAALEEIKSVFNGIDTNSIYYNYKSVNDPKSLFSDDPIISAVWDPSKAYVAPIDADDLAHFVLEEHQREIPEGKLNDWLEERIFCVTTEVNGHTVPNNDEQRKLRVQVSMFISSPNVEDTLSFGDGLKYKLQKIQKDGETYVQITNSSESFEKYYNELFGDASSHKLGLLKLNNGKYEIADEGKFKIWIQARKKGSGESAEELKTHPLFFYLNNVNRRYVGIGAFAPVQLQLKRDKGSVELVSGQDVQISATLFNPYSVNPSNQQLNGDPNAKIFVIVCDNKGNPFWTGENPSGTFNIPADKLPPSGSDIKYEYKLVDMEPLSENELNLTINNMIPVAGYVISANQIGVSTYHAFFGASYNLLHDTIYVGYPITNDQSYIFQENIYNNPATTIKVKGTSQFSFNIYLVPKFEMPIRLPLMSSTLPRYQKKTNVPLVLDNSDENINSLSSLVQSPGKVPLKSLVLIQYTNPSVEWEKNGNITISQKCWLVTKNKEAMQLREIRFKDGKFENGISSFDVSYTGNESTIQRTLVLTDSSGKQVEVGTATYSVSNKDGKLEIIFNGIKLKEDFINDNSLGVFYLQKNQKRNLIIAYENENGKEAIIDGVPIWGELYVYANVDTNELEQFVLYDFYLSTGKNKFTKLDAEFDRNSGKFNLLYKGINIGSMVKTQDGGIIFELNNSPGNFEGFLKEMYNLNSGEYNLNQVPVKTDPGIQSR